MNLTQPELVLENQQHAIVQMITHRDSTNGQSVILLLDILSPFCPL
jgi:hypothetical protein